jgi:hypothetical protein
VEAAVAAWEVRAAEHGSPHDGHSGFACVLGSFADDMGFARKA